MRPKTLLASLLLNIFGLLSKVSLVAGWPESKLSTEIRGKALPGTKIFLSTSCFGKPIRPLTSAFGSLRASAVKLVSQCSLSLEACPQAFALYELRAASFWSVAENRALPSCLLI
jgi:hypothetical protein